MAKHKKERKRRLRKPTLNGFGKPSRPRWWEERVKQAPPGEDEEQAFLPGTEKRSTRKERLAKLKAEREL